MRKILTFLAVTGGAALAAAAPAAATMPLATAAPAVAASSQAPYKVETSEIEDLKSVYATVRSTDRIEARARIGGTVASLMVDEGSEVDTGKVIAIIADQKLALKLKALDAQIAGLSAQRDNTERELGRQEELIKRGFTPKAKVDELRTQLEVVTNQLKSATAERDVVRRQVEEGEVLAPANGRVLLVPVTIGSVVLPGESLATIAANAYVLRLELPERHARFVRKGDVIRLGARSLNAGEQKLVKGEIGQVYPELQSGRVIADANVEGLGDFFVGERVLVYISGGMRSGIVIPRAYVTTRYGYDFVRVSRKGGDVSEVVVQLGQPVELKDGSTGIEVLGGLNPGDEILKP
ncbi:MAG: efflux RND transporter periplasmic adaptor subunit [Hyphomicrobiaceae bacterium]|nr:efflux RND transporter periplasmic adaptor subunit [Hyphomicrobiaceae bacterium]